MEEQEKTITFAKFLKVAFGSWKRLLIVTLAVGVVGTVALYFGYNRSAVRYTTTFTYNKNDLNEGKYCDGSDFYYTDIFSLENIKSVIASKADYKSIDADKLYYSNKFGFSRSTANDVVSYNLTLPTNVFSDSTQVKSFVQDLARYPITKDKSLMNKEHFEANLVLYDSAPTYENQIAYLKNHANSLRNLYSALSSNNKESASVVATINANNTEINNLVGGANGYLDYLSYSIKEYGYVKDYNSQEAKNFESTIQSLKTEREINANKIKALEEEIKELTSGSSSLVLNSLDSAISNLTQRNADIEEEIKVIQKKIDAKSNTSVEYANGKGAFELRLSYFRQKLSEATESFVQVLRTVNDTSDEAVFASSSIVSSTGGISLPIEIALSLIVGLVAACIVNLIVDRKKLSE